jgi:cation transporter-like permease
MRTRDGTQHNTSLLTVVYPAAFSNSGNRKRRLAASTSTNQIKEILANINLPPIVANAANAEIIEM